MYEINQTNQINQINQIEEDLWKSWISEGVVNELFIDKYPAEIKEICNCLEADLEFLPRDVLVLPTLSIRETKDLMDIIGDIRKLPVHGFVFRNPELFKEPDLDKLKETLEGVFRAHPACPLSDLCWGGNHRAKWRRALS